MKTIMRTAVGGICLLVGSACLADDPISNLTQRLNSENGMWANGAQPRFSLPSNSAPTQVIAKAAQAYHVTTGTNDNLRILEIRTVHLNYTLGGSNWEAALVEGVSGKKILLFHCVSDDRWWIRFFDVEDARPHEVPEETSREPAHPQH